MRTSQRIIAAAVTSLLAVATPAAAHPPAPAPPAEQPAEQQRPPASTHGRFLPSPDQLTQAQEFAEAGLPPAFLHLSGSLTETVTFESAPRPGQEVPPVASAEITQNSTEYVFDLCDLLDQAAAEEAPAA